MKMIKMLKKIFKINNAGMSLVEMVCAVGVMSIICMSIGGIMVSGARNYQSGMNEVTLQQKAQFVVNQLDDFLIDTIKTATFVSDTLTMVDYDGATEYTIQHDGDKLVFTKVVKDAVGSILTSETEVIADGVDSFSADTTDFNRNGNIKLNLGFDDGVKRYSADFNITSRNAMNTGTTAAPSALINVEPEIVVEPNQNYEIVTDVIGDTCILKFEIEGTHDAATKVVPNTTNPKNANLIVSSAESEPNFTVKISAISVADGTTVLHSTVVTVYVRRVINIDLVLTKVPGGSNRLGTGNTYNVEAIITGNNLDRFYGIPSDDDYVDPREIDWSLAKTGVECADVSSTGTYITLAPYNRAGSSPQIVVTATSRHSNGKANKTRMPYDTVSKSIVIDDPDPYYILSGSDLYRGSDQHLGWLVSDGGNPPYPFAREVMAAHGITSQINTGEICREYRWRKASEPDGWSHPWESKWKQLTEFGSAIRIDEVFNDIPCADSYEVEVRYYCKKAGYGDHLFPADTVPKDMYVMSAIIGRAHVIEDVKVNGSVRISHNEFGNIGTISVGSKVTFTAYKEPDVRQVDAGIRFERYIDHYEVKKMNPITGLYTASANVTLDHMNDNYGIEKGIIFNEAGTYRIETWLQRNDHSTDEAMGDPSTGVGFYYVTVN